MVFNLFQFHKGTIKAGGGTNNQYPLWLFQFHKGTIKAQKCDFV